MKILLARTGGLGDAILTLPVAHRIKRVNPTIELYALGNETMLTVARLFGMFRGFHSFDESGFAGLYSYSEPTDFIRSFFSYFDEVYFFSAGSGENITRNVTGSGVTICRILDPRPPVNWNRHIVEHLMTILNDPPDTSYNLPDNVVAAPGNSHLKRKGIVIHPGSGSRFKNWPIERFIQLAERLGPDVKFILGPVEVERCLEKEIPAERCTVAYPGDLKELCRVITSASLYIGNDSGVSHLAALYGIPSIVLFGSTVPVVWRPLGKDITVVSSQDRTMNGISVDEVIGTVKKIRQL